MDSTNSMRLMLSWDGREYQCLADMTVCMRIEERVVLHTLAERVLMGAEHAPISHACWVVYCLLERAGAPVTPQLVYDAAKEGLVADETYKTALQWLVAEVYGQAPQEEDAPPPKKSAPRRRKSGQSRRST